MAFLSDDASTALVGAAAGWLLATGTGGVSSWMTRRRKQRTAARLIYFELVNNAETIRSRVAPTLAVEKTTGPIEFEDHEWRAHSKSLVDVGRFAKHGEQLAVVALAYSMLDKAAAAELSAASEPEKRAMLEVARRKVVDAMRATGGLSGFSGLELRERLALDDDHQ